MKIIFRVFALALSLFSLSCSQESATRPNFGTEYLVPRTIGQSVEGLPWITDLHIADLDQDGLLDVIASEGRLNKVVWIRQV